MYVFIAPNTPDGWKQVDVTVLRALDTSLFAFARWQTGEADPKWFIEGNKVYHKSTADRLGLGNSQSALRGHFSTLKMSLAGLTLIADLSVSVFWNSGELINIMCAVMNLSDPHDMVRLSERGELKNHMRKLFRLKDIKIRSLHNCFSSKLISFGDSADRQMFDCAEMGGRVSVKAYFEFKAETDSNIRKYLSNGKLKYPSLPCVEFKKRGVYLPVELMIVPPGQLLKKLYPDTQAKVIKYAAVAPHERMNHILSSDSAIAEIRKELISGQFGVGNNSINPDPIIVKATLLPPAQLVYGGNFVVEPGLAGSWNKPDRCTAFEPPRGDKIYYAMDFISISDKPRDSDWTVAAKKLTLDLQEEAEKFGIRMTLVDLPSVLSSSDTRDLDSKYRWYRDRNVRIAVAIMEGDCYGIVKTIADTIGIPSQCLKWERVLNPPRQFHNNVIMKMNAKMGGVNHALASRLPLNEVTNLKKSDGDLFQNPPASISWIFDDLTMLVGMNSCHPEAGMAKSPSHHAIVGSMDGSASRYCAYMGTSSGVDKPHSIIEDGAFKLLSAFRKRNGNIPRHIVIYRDGISESEFKNVVMNELPGFKNAIQLMGYEENYAKITIVICQKRHSTRFVFEEKTDGSVKYLNPCPGVVMDSSGDKDSVTHCEYNEFLLNSHAPIQGSCKPCKYTIIYDEIGFKVRLYVFTYICMIKVKSLLFIIYLCLAP
jgi:eukaryotic translation initiation factor 2C